MVNQLTAASLKANWGDTRRFRCAEVVSAVLHEPDTVDAHSAYVMKNLMDMRRLLLKDQSRMGSFMGALAVKRTRSGAQTDTDEESPQKLRRLR